MKLKHILVLTIAGVAAACGSANTYADQTASNSVEEPMEGYLFTYFTGNRMPQEAVHFALSLDGFNFYKLNNGQPVLDSRKVSSTGGMRDPHILRKADGSGFYMVATDMVSGNGWDSNRAMVLLKSDSLTDWSWSVVNMQKEYPNQERLKRVWAPQSIYDPEAGRYMVYWSMKYGTDGNDVIYYAYANDDFTALATEPDTLFMPADGRSCIDADIVYLPADGLYHMFYKTEGHGNGIKVATTPSLSHRQWTESPDYKQQTSHAVEGAGTFRLIGTDTYILMYDVYMNGAYQFTESTDLQTFKVIDDSVSMDFHPRHGTVIPITRREMRRLIEKWPSDTLPESLRGL